jgi:rubredoxin
VRTARRTGYTAHFAVQTENNAMDVSPEFKSWMCLICGWIYNEAEGYPEENIAPGTRWADVPPNWGCPECGARKDDFEMIEI